MLPLTGYADRLSVRPGETIKFHVAHTDSDSSDVEARIVRVISADPNPAGMGLKTISVPATGLKTIAAPTAQRPASGSFASILGAATQFSLPQDFTLVATVFVTALPSHPTAVASIIRQHHGIGLGITGSGRLAVSSDALLQTDRAMTARDGASWRHVDTSVQVAERCWYHLWLSFTRATGTVTVGACQAGRRPTLAMPIVATINVGTSVPAGAAAMMLAGGYPLAGERDVLGQSGFNGKIERPMIFDRALTADEISRATAGETISGLVAAWDFSRDMHTSSIVDTGPHGLHGKLHNSPTRAVRGSTWTGREQCFRHAPDQYAAIHFHDDDIDDCRWNVTHEYTVPADLKSGAYALLLKAGAAEENIPFFVVPPKGTSRAKLAVLVSTFTYTVYGNHARPEWTNDPKWRAAWVQQTKDWKAYPHNPGDHREYGLSTYNYHTDGSGIALASWHRPMLNLRIGYLTYPYPEIRGSGLRHYPADSHLLAWLEAKGHDYDLITDWELHHEGIELLQRYTCVMTGSHPEYHTGEMLDALESYRDGGGRFMYLGGNGFYWKIALSPDKPGLIEIRRAEGGIRAWAAEPGEYYNQFDGEYGGLWRRNGRPPQQLVGVGFTAQGNFVGSYYRIKPEARQNPRTAWIFDGITDDTIGGFGFSGHGAAGFELDRADKRLGTPANAVVVAQSEGHPPEAPWVLVPEEQLTHITTIPGESHKQLIRADMTLFENPGNGCVFATGSITFCGSLPHNNFDNSISTLLGNVLRRFLDPASTFPVV